MDDRQPGQVRESVVVREVDADAEEVATGRKSRLDYEHRHREGVFSRSNEFSKLRRIYQNFWADGDWDGVNCRVKYEGDWMKAER